MATILWAVRGPRLIRLLKHETNPVMYTIPQKKLINMHVNILRVLNSCLPTWKSCQCLCVLSVSVCTFLSEKTRTPCGLACSCDFTFLRVNQRHVCQHRMRMTKNQSLAQYRAETERDSSLRVKRMEAGRHSRYSTYWRPASG